ACHVRPTGAYEVLSLPDPVVPIARRLGAAPLRPFRRYARLGSPTLSIPASPRRSGSRSLHLDRSQIVDDLRDPELVRAKVLVPRRLGHRLAPYGHRGSPVRRGRAPGDRIVDADRVELSPLCFASWVRSVGFGVRCAARTPSPLPSGAWHALQY